MLNVSLPLVIPMMSLLRQARSKWPTPLRGFRLKAEEGISIASSDRADRRYHGVKKSHYALPNDKEEHERLDKMQLMCRSLIGGNILAPISPQPKNIIDVGAGSGAWCLEVAKDYPSTQVCGIDISPIERPNVPENCKFELADLNDGLKFDNDSIDLANSRYIAQLQSANLIGTG